MAFPIGRTAAGLFPLLIGLLAVPLFPAGAAPPGTELTLDPVRVTAHPTGADERTSAIFVDDLANRTGTPVDAAALFRNIPGVHLQEAGAGNRETLYIRGAEENYALILDGGVPLNDPTNTRGGAVDLSLTEPSLQQTLAVVRGPASVSHGPEAVAGVVHLDPRAPDDPASSFYVAGGTGGHYRAVGSIGLSALRPLHLRIGAALHGQEESATGERIRRQSVRFQAASRDPGWSASAAWTDHEASGFPDDSGGPLFARSPSLETRHQEAILLRATWSPEPDSWNLSADYGHFAANLDSPGVAPGPRDPAGLPATESDSRFERLRVAATWTGEFAGWPLTIGLDTQWERGKDDSLLDFGPFQLPARFSLERTRIGAFAESTVAMAPELSATLGLRVDRFDDGDRQITARGGLLWQPRPELQLRLNAGTAYKPPSFYAVANPLVGNPDLLAETGRSIDAGGRFRLWNDLAWIDVSLYSTRFRNGIDFDPGPPPRLVNRTEIVSRGIEIAAAVRPHPDLDLTAVATWTDARSEPGGERLRLRPDWTTGFTARWTPDTALDLSLSTRIVGPVADTSIPTDAVTIETWIRSDLTVRWRVAEGCALEVAVDNLFDSDDTVAAGYPLRDRRFRGGVQLNF